jgi:hypothetical protein
MTDDERPTDQQVAAIAGTEFIFDRTTRALAVEVQQSRQRRCANCAHYQPYACGLFSDTRETFEVTPDWFCADFTPR